MMRNMIFWSILATLTFVIVYGFIGKRTPKARKSYFKHVGIHLFLLTVGAIVIFPMLWVISLSLQPEGFSKPLSLRLIPENPSLDAYRTVLVNPWSRFCSNPTDRTTCMTFLRLLWNSLLVSLGTAVFSVALGASAAYAFSRFKFIGREAGMIGFILLLMLPGLATIAPLFVLLNAIKVAGEPLRKTLIGLSIAYASGTLPFAIWNLKGYFDTIPKEIEESARIDGATVLQTFFRIILPLSLPAMAVTVLFAFLAGWTEFAVAWIFIENTERYTLAMALNSMIGEFTTPWNEFAAMALVMSLPILVLFFFLQRAIISGLTVGGVK